jgi:hypothetical protein
LTGDSSPNYEKNNRKESNETPFEEHDSSALLFVQNIGRLLPLIQRLTSVVALAIIQNRSEFRLSPSLKKGEGI